MSRILHISADYPDPLAPAKTRAVSNLLAMVDGHEHRVISINRVHWRIRPTALPFKDAAGADHRALAYGAPGKGLFLRRYLGRVTEWIAADCAAADFRPDIVHAHKLTIEGFVGVELARRFGARLALSIQGNTDAKIAGARRDLRPALGDIWRAADVAFPFAPWAFDAMNQLLGARTGPTYALPCPTGSDEIMAPTDGPPTVVVACNLKDHANKNLAALIDAVGALSADIPDIRLQIVGGGDAAAYAMLEAKAAADAPGRVEFLGAVPHADIQGVFNRAGAFALVSHRESYGMVFAEALMAGAPCLIPARRGIDGYFDDGGVVVAADPGDPAAIRAGLRRLLLERDAFKARLKTLGQAGGLEFMRRTAIRQAYEHGLAVAVGQADPAPSPGVVRLA